MSFAEHARTLFSFNEWANERILAAAAKCTDEQFAQVRDNLAHALGTHVWWCALWMGVPNAVANERGRAAGTGLDTADKMWAAYARAHDDIRGFAMSIEDADWHRAKKWWAPYYDSELPLGGTITQVINHGTQHRSEIAIVVSLHGHSPGDLDYLNFAMEMQGEAPPG